MDKHQDMELGQMMLALQQEATKLVMEVANHNRKE
jgi:hypothetical protein